MENPATRAGLYTLSRTETNTAVLLLCQQKLSTLILTYTSPYPNM